MKSKLKFLIPAIAVVALSIVAHAIFFGRHESLKAPGTLEARKINVGSKIGGRITQVVAHEGDRVQAHQLLVAFDDAELEAKLEQARGQLLQAQANLEKMLHGSRPEKIAESQAAVRTPKGEPGFRAEELSQAIHSTHFRSKGSEYCEIEKNKRTAKSQLRLKIWRGVAQLFLPLTAFGFAGEQPLVIASQAGAPVLLSGTVTAALLVRTEGLNHQYFD